MPTDEKIESTIDTNQQEIFSHFHKYIERTSTLFLEVKKEDLKQTYDNETTRDLVSEFLFNPDVKNLYLLQEDGSDQVQFLIKIENINPGYSLLYIKKK